MTKHCYTCEHIKKSAITLPCLGCVGKQDHPNWELAKRIKNKDCNKCRIRECNNCGKGE